MGFEFTQQIITALFTLETKLCSIQAWGFKQETSEIFVLQFVISEVLSPERL